MDPKEKCILVVEDNERLARAVQLILQRQGFRVINAYDGLEGIEKAVEETPDLILLDIGLPVIDGYEVARRLTGHPATAHIPIIILSVKGRIDGLDPRDKHKMARRIRQQLRGLDAGAIEFLTKPIKAAELIKVVKAVLRKYNF